MDSLPLPACANAKKKQYYYGFKGYFEIDNNGLIRAYVVTKASKTDTALVKTLLSEYRCSKVIADKGYMKIREDEKITNDLKRKRRYIETFFSSWVNLFDIERICVKSLIGFQLRLEQCFLVYTVQLLEIN